MRFKILLLALGVSLAFALHYPTREPLEIVAASALPKTVMVHNLIDYVPEGSTVTHRGMTLGAGVFITPRGHILTCAHLFGHTRANNVSIVTASGDTYKAEILVVDKRKDLALIKIEPIGGPVAYAEIADPRTLAVGQSVLAIGNPLGLEFSACHGIISALNRDFAFAYNATQSDAMINPGNSGGPLFNLKGELIGINSFILLAVPPIAINSGLGFSVQPGQIIEFLTRFKGLERVRGLK